ncbi:Oxysterol-binding protein-domain-containing protein [Lentinula aff. lateritia]|uniref:Oxysterol-binding protein-domain-containing protein n=1 Tax=Lentinula aff. lateritia TaxID=2804960 RepID=A0ACC1TJZ2_9AGAR|nr:Oxysterol-binding protein-domain-containing protein [Lentinula aff. lateritia]
MTSKKNERSERNANIAQSPFSPLPSPPPPLKGYLLKYTNLAKGYNPRWFVLKGGVLSYYRRQEDETVASRGSISIKSVVVKVSPSDKLRFEVYSGYSGTTSTTSSVSQKWYMKANHPVEAARWIGAIGEWKVWSQQQQPQSSPTGQVASSSSSATRTSSSSHSAFTPPTTTATTTTTSFPPPTSTRTSISNSISNSLIGGLSTIRKKRKANFADNKSTMDLLNPPSDVESLHKNLHGIHSEVESRISGMSRTSRASKKANSRFGYSDEEEDEDSEGMEDIEYDEEHDEEHDGDNDDDEDDDGVSLPLPYSDTYSQQARLIFDQIEIMTTQQSSSSLQSLKNLISTYISMTASRESHLLTNLTSTKHRLSGRRSSLSRTRKSLRATKESLRASETARKKLEVTVKQAKRAQKAWEESMKVVLEEEVGLERQLKRTSRNFNSLKRGSRVIGNGPTSPTAASATITGALVGEEELKTPTALGYYLDSSGSPKGLSTASEGIGEDREDTDDVEDEDDNLEDDDDEDEFFDAIEANNIPNLVVPAQLQQAAPTSLASSMSSITTAAYATATATPNSSISTTASLTVPDPSSDVFTSDVISTFASYSPYAFLRASLPIRTERPATSLWSALKNSIGKDLTKISFPVYFNEPTSMLQRMAEDMEFSECLDIASSTPSPHLRIAYIAAFAMSNYSSTIGRIAKPFNPMLGETFEYVCLGDDFEGERKKGRQGIHEQQEKQGKQGYRYVSEQVSHHPPISACWAESLGMVKSEDNNDLNRTVKTAGTGWRYYGEVDAQNKFMGKSFEIRPTGVAHVQLRIPKAWVTDKLPLVQDEEDDGEMVLEHYTWKKVTTNVSGFILGSPTIDHYGDMVIKNHLTNDQCVLTFKPRGWRGKDAYEIAGQVVSSQGFVVYEIAGKWDSQLVIRPAGNGGLYGPGSGGPRGPGGAPTREAFNTDITLNLDNTISAPTQQYILLWRNTPKPSGTPFNLTPFALTLNDLPTLPTTSTEISTRSSEVRSLKTYLPPTDSRLRPDQRAFEMGLWDLANVLKGQQEEKQRATRRRKEKENEGATHRHQPRWFVAETDGDTGERVWMPLRVEAGEDKKRALEYWVERERVWKEIQEVVSEKEEEKKKGKAKWRGVEDIFVDEPGRNRKLESLRRTHGTVDTVGTGTGLNHARTVLTVPGVAFNEPKSIA